MIQPSMAPSSTVSIGSIIAWTFSTDSLDVAVVEITDVGEGVIECAGAFTDLEHADHQGNRPTVWNAEVTFWPSPINCSTRTRPSSMTRLPTTDCVVRIESRIGMPDE